MLKAASLLVMLVATPALANARPDAVAARDGGLRHAPAATRAASEQQALGQLLARARQALRTPAATVAGLVPSLVSANVSDEVARALAPGHTP